MCEIFGVFTDVRLHLHVAASCAECTVRSTVSLATDCQPAQAASLFIAGTTRNSWHYGHEQRESRVNPLAAH